MKISKKSFIKEIFFLFVTLLASFLSAFGLHFFVFSANFAPAGIDGVATMLQKVSGVSAGVYSLIFNIPLLIFSWFVLKRRYVIYTIIFSIVSSLLLVLFENIGFPQYSSPTLSERLVSSVFSGLILGFRTGVMLKIGASTGGVDIVAGLVQRKRTYGNIEKVITFICYLIIVVSFFVYENNLNSVLLAIIQMFVFEKAAGVLLKDTRNAVELKIITKHPEELKNDIIYTLKHGATIVSSKGMFTNEDSSIIMSVINIRQIPEFLQIIKKYPNTFVYYSEVSGVRGNFRWKKEDEAK